MQVPGERRTVATVRFAIKTMPEHTTVPEHTAVVEHTAVLEQTTEPLPPGPAAPGKSRRRRLVGGGR